MSKDIIQKEEITQEKPWEKYLLELKKVREKYRERQRERTEYIKNKKSLRNIETALLRLGSISNITDENADSEIEKIMESGLTKDIGNFSIDGFEFF